MPTPRPRHPRPAATPDLQALRAPFTETYARGDDQIRALELAFHTAVLILYPPDMQHPAPRCGTAWRAGFQHMRAIIARALARFRPRASPPARQFQGAREPRPRSAPPACHAPQSQPAPGHPSPEFHAPEAQTPEIQMPEPHIPEPHTPEPHTPEPGEPPSHTLPPALPPASHRTRCASIPRRRGSSNATRPRSRARRPLPPSDRAPFGRATAARINLGSPGVPPRPP